MNKITIILALGMLLTACSKAPEPAPLKLEKDQLGIKLSLEEFNATASSGKTTIETLNGYLFVNEVLVQSYPNLAIDAQELKLPIVYYEGIQASLYMIANTKGVTTSLNDPTTLVIGSTREADFPLFFAGKENLTPTPLPLGRKVDLSNINPAEPLAIALQHAHARLDLKIEEPGVEITQIEFKNLPGTGKLIGERTPQPEYTGSKFDFTQVYPTPVTASQVIGYINEGNGLNIPVMIYGRFNGIETKMSLTLPAQIERNTAYTIKVSKVGVTLTAVVTVEDWVDGGESDATPDLSARVLFRPESSSLPEGARYSPTLDTLYIPSSKDSHLTLELNADYPIDAEMIGSRSNITLNPVDGFNRFQLQVNAQQAGAPAYYSYIKIKNRFFEDYYGERLVVTVTPNYDAPIADLEPLGTVPGIQLSDNLAQISPYGGASISIPSGKIQVNSRAFSTVDRVQMLPSSVSPYKAIRLSSNGANLKVESVQNTTSEPLTAVGIVSGTGADGAPIAAIVSFSIPPVPAHELAAMRAMEVQMGGNTWMQFNTSGSYIEDMKKAVAISKLGAITFEKIKNNFALFGSYKTDGTYNNAAPCPPGFRTPSVQEFLNLVGVPNASGLDALKAVSSGPVTTTGGMTITHRVLKDNSTLTSEAAVSIAKEGATLWLTNGRFVATPNRSYFELWYSGAFFTNQAQNNSYVWPRRCVKIANYNGF